jgi:hypothetical protein
MKLLIVQNSLIVNKIIELGDILEKRRRGLNVENLSL